MRSIAL